MHSSISDTVTNMHGKNHCTAMPSVATMNTPMAAKKLSSTAQSFHPCSRRGLGRM